MKSLEEISQLVATNLHKQLIPPRSLLSRFRFIEEKSKLSHASLDPLYLPFYHHLGKEIKATKLLYFGLGLGLPGACFLFTCTSVTHLLAFQQLQKEFYSRRLAETNLKIRYPRELEIYVGNVYDPVFLDLLGGHAWDFALIDERTDQDTYRLWLTTIWDVLALDGFICMERVLSDKHAKNAFEDFCYSKQRPFHIFRTRYGTGLVRK